MVNRGDESFLIGSHIGRLADPNPSKQPHGGQGKGIRGKNVCRRCGKPYDGVTPHGPRWCTRVLPESNPSYRSHA